LEQAELFSYILKNLLIRLLLILWQWRRDGNPHFPIESKMKTCVQSESNPYVIIGNVTLAIYTIEIKREGTNLIVLFAKKLWQN
jgi:hypothetical protein